MGCGVARLKLILRRIAKNSYNLVIMGNSGEFNVGIMNEIDGLLMSFFESL
jgi:hypothetical protein